MQLADMQQRLAAQTAVPAATGNCDEYDVDSPRRYKRPPTSPCPAQSGQWQAAVATAAGGEGPGDSSQEGDGQGGSTGSSSHDPSPAAFWLSCNTGVTSGAAQEAGLLQPCTPVMQQLWAGSEVAVRQGHLQGPGLYHVVTAETEPPACCTGQGLAGASSGQGWDSSVCQVAEPLLEAFPAAVSTEVPPSFKDDVDHVNRPWRRLLLLAGTVALTAVTAGVAVFWVRGAAPPARLASQ